MRGAGCGAPAACRARGACAFGRWTRKPASPLPLMVKTSIERKTAKPTAGRAAPASRSTSQPRPSSPHPHPRSSGRGPRNWAKTEPIGKPSPRKTLCVRRSCVSSEARGHLCSLREARSPGPSGDRAGAPTTLQFRRDPSPPRGEDQRGDGTCQPGRPCHVRCRDGPAGWIPGSNQAAGSQAGENILGSAM